MQFLTHLSLEELNNLINQQVPAAIKQYHELAGKTYIGKEDLIQSCLLLLFASGLRSVDLGQIELTSENHQLLHKENLKVMCEDG